MVRLGAKKKIMNALYRCFITSAVLSAIGDAIGVAPNETPCHPQRVWELLHPEAAGVAHDARQAHSPAHARMSR